MKRFDLNQEDRRFWEGLLFAFASFITVVLIGLAVWQMFLNPAHADTPPDHVRITTGPPECIVGRCSGNGDSFTEDSRIFMDTDGRIFDATTGHDVAQMNFFTRGVLDRRLTELFGTTIDMNNQLATDLRNEMYYFEQTVAQRFSDAETRAYELAAINAALDMIGPTDQGRVKFNLQATTVNDDAQALGVTVVGTRYKNGGARLSYGIGVGSNLSGNTFNEYVGKGHFGVEF